MHHTHITLGVRAPDLLPAVSQRSRLTRLLRVFRPTGLCHATTQTLTQLRSSLQRGTKLLLLTSCPGFPFSARPPGTCSEPSPAVSSRVSSEEDTPPVNDSLSR